MYSAAFLTDVNVKTSPVASLITIIAWAFKLDLANIVYSKIIRLIWLFFISSFEASECLNPTNDPAFFKILYSGLSK